MNAWIESMAYWLADFYLAATVLLIAALVAMRACSQPAKRLAVAKAAIVAAALLAALCALPGWSVVSLGGVDAREATEAASALIPSEVARVNDVPRFDEVEPVAQASAPLPQPKRADIASTWDVAWLTVLVAGYFVGCAAVATWLALGVVAAARLVRLAETFPVELREALRSETDAGELLVSREIDVPVALGVFRPRVLLPREWIETRSARELSTVLAHEAAHIRNHDLHWLAASRLLLIVLWAQPFFWWLRRQMRLDQETLADAAAAEVAGRHAYAEQLVAWARDVVTRPRPLLPASVGLWEGASQLRRRVAVLLDERFSVLRQCPQSWRRVTTILALLGAFAISFITWEPSQSEEARTAGDELTAEEVARVADAIRVLRETEGIGNREQGQMHVADDWAIAIQTLTEVGKPAVPALIAALDEEQRDHPMSKLAFALRAIGDPRAVPSLIRAIPRTLLPSRSDFGLRIADPELLAFMQLHDLTSSNEGDDFDYGRAFREVVGALQRLTGTNQGDMELNWVHFGETASQQRIQRKLFYDLAERWAQWWSKNWQQLGVDQSYADVRLPALEPEAVAAAATTLPVHKRLGLVGHRGEWIVEPANVSGRRCFVDLDTARQGDWPSELGAFDKTSEISQPASNWAREQGFDLVGVRTQVEGFGEPIYCLQPLGMKVWEITPEEQRELGRAMLGEIPYPLGKPVELLSPRPEPYKGPDKYELGGTAFLFLTQEGTAGLLRMTAQVTDTNVQIGRPSTRDDQFSPVGFYRGAKVSFAVMAETDRPQAKSSRGRDAVELKFQFPAPSGPPQAPVEPERLGKPFDAPAPRSPARDQDPKIANSESDQSASETRHLSIGGGAVTQADSEPNGAARSTAAIEGQVVEFGSGEPAANVIVKAAGVPFGASPPAIILPADDLVASGVHRASTRTDSKGRYQFADLPAGEYTVWAESPIGDIAEGASVCRGVEGVRVGESDSPTIAPLLTMGPGAKIYGRLVDGDTGEPLSVAGRSVTLLAMGWLSDSSMLQELPLQQVPVSAEGTFEIRAYPGESQGIVTVQEEELFANRQKIIYRSDDEGLQSRKVLDVKHGESIEATFPVWSQELLDRRKERRQAAFAHFQPGKYAEAVKAFTQQIAVDPQDPMLMMGRSLANEYDGRWREAIADCEQFLVMQPASDSQKVRLADLLATVPDAKLRDGRRALSLAQAGLSAGRGPYALQALAAAEAEAGDFEAAAATQREAIEKAPEGMRAEMRKRLEAYEAGRAWRREGREDEAAQ